MGDLIGEGAAQEQAVVGETPNLAARLQALAGPNEVVIGPGTQRLVGGLFESGRSGEQRAQGLRREGPGLAGAGRKSRGEPVRGAQCDRPHAVGRPAARVGHAARPLRAGQGWRGPGGAAVRRAGHRQVTPRACPARAVGRRAAHAASLLLLALSCEQRAPSDHRAIGTSGGVRARRSARTQAR